MKNKKGKNIEKDNDVFKINEAFIGQYPNDVQNLALDVIIKFLQNLDSNEGINILNNQKSYNLKFHILDNQKVKDISST